MNKTEAIHVYSLLCWLTDQPRPAGGHYTDDDARYAATELCDRANKALSAGLTPATVDHWFHDQRPRVVAGPAYVLLLNASEVRGFFNEEECTCAGDTADPCITCRLARITDDQLDDAARALTGRDCPLDDAIGATREAIVQLAYRYATEENDR